MTNKFRGGTAPYFVLTLGLGVCAFLLLHRLGQPYLTQWDEVVHANVVHNLYRDCCDPKLHSVDLGTDPVLWNNNYIWLHKPLLPFYLRATLYRLTGESLFMFRLPSAVFALLTAVILFLIARSSSTAWTATGVALLFAGNRFVFELVQGRQFSDLSDVMNILLLTIVLGLCLSTAAGRPLFFSSRESAAAYRVTSLAVALFTALAYSCKGGLALPGLVVFAVALVVQRGWRQSVGDIVVMVLFFGALIFPGYYYFSHRFPQQFSYEQHHQIQHLFADVEGWGRPWYYYITGYWRSLLGLPLGVLGFLAVFASLRPGLRNRRNMLLVFWILIYVVPLSFGVSKIANFIEPVMPAVILLAVFVAHDLPHSVRRMWVYPLTGIFLLAFVTNFFDNLTILRFLGSHRFPVLAVSLGVLVVFGLLVSAGKLRRVALPSVSQRTAAATLVLMFVSIVIQNLLTNWITSNTLPWNHEEQMELKDTADAIKGRIPRNAVVLVEEVSPNDHRSAHLYFQYWSGVNSLPAQQLAFAKDKLSRTHPLFLLVKEPLPGAIPLGQEPFGYLYRVN